MTKVAIKNENITSFGGIYIISLWLFKLPHWFGWGGHDYARTKNPQKSPYQWINPKNVTSIYKSTSQGIMLRN